MNFFVCETKTLNWGKFNNTKNKFFSAKNFNALFAIIAPKAIFKKATGRNKIKRQLSELIYRERDNFKQNISVIIMVKKGALFKNFASTKAEFQPILKKYRLLN